MVVKAIICIICAMDVEYQNIVKYFNIQNQTILQGSYPVSVCNNPVCLIVKCGIGKKTAYNCLISILQVYRDITMVFSVGTAGALFPHLTIGDIVWGNHIIDYDGNSYVEEIKSGWIQKEYNQLEEIGYYGKIVSSNVIVHSQEVKQELYTIYQGMCVEMESAGIIRGCNLRGIPFTTIKVISDYADEGAIYNIIKSQMKVCNKLGFFLQRMIKQISVGT